MFCRTLAAFSLIFLGSAQSFSATLGSQQVDAIVRQVIDPTMNPPAPTKHPVGLVVGVVTQEGIQVVYGFGSIVLGGADIPNGDTLFEIASISKTFTATLLAQEVGQGKIQLNDPVSADRCTWQMVSAFCYHGVPTTYLDLATHTAGLPVSPDFPGYRLDEYTRPEIDRYLADFSLKHAPGTAYWYSNLGFGYLGDLLTDLEGESYDRLVTERIADVLGMNHTRVILTPDEEAQLQSGYTAGLDGSPDFEKAPLYHFTDQSALSGSAAIHSTANDLLIYLAGEMGLERASPLSSLSDAMDLSQIPRFSHAPDILPFSVALGWEILDIGDITFHSGALPGFDSFVGFQRDLGIGVVVLSNTSFYVPDQSGALVGFDQATGLGVQLISGLARAREQLGATF
ncbi:MAG: serine hydrolase [Oligoflexia bacterium]|nr:serine hydrolase [Oligoflexia bacterium]